MADYKDPGLDAWKKKFGLPEDATEAEVNAAAQEQSPSLAKQFLQFMGKKRDESLAGMREESHEDMQSTRNNAANWAGKFGADADTQISIATPMEKETIRSSPTHTMVGGGDTYTKSAEDWDKIFNPPAPAPEPEAPAAAPEAAPEEAELPPVYQAAAAPKLQPTDKIDSKVGSLFQEAKAMLTSGKGEGDDDEFAAELKRLRGDYAQAKSDIDKREIMHTIADAITQFGAGYASQATGRDLTNIKTKQHDFQKDKEFAQQELQTDLGDLKARRTEDQQKRRDVADMSYKQTSLKLDEAKAEQARVNQENQNILAVWKEGNDQGYRQWMGQETQRHNAAMEDYQRSMLEAKGEKDAGTIAAKEKAARDKLFGDTNNTLTRIMSTPEFRKDPEKGMAALVPVASRVGIPPAELRKALFKPGMIWGENPQDYMDASVNVSNLIQKHAQAPTLIQMTHPKHGTMSAPNEEAAAKMEKAGWKRS